jgi:hypothetical protein
MPTESERYRIHIVRRQDQNAWAARARIGDEVARICTWASSNFMKAIRAGHSTCACCNRVFAGNVVPRAFVVLIPVEREPDQIKAKAGGVCAECSNHGDQWIVDQCMDRQVLMGAPTLNGDDRIH